MTVRFWDSVTTGDSVGDVAIPVTWKTIFQHVAGSRDYMPYHYQQDFTRSLGIRDVFVNTTFNLALFGRCATDWSGPESDIRRMTLQMVDQVCPGDTVVARGTVREKTADSSGEATVVLDLVASVGERTTARCSVTLAMPSRAAPIVGPAPKISSAAPAAADPDMPPSAREKLGRPSPLRVGPYPVSEAQIGYFCEMVRDANPLYLDHRYAAASRHGGIVAPPQSLRVWCMPRSTQMGIDSARPDVDLPDQLPWPDAVADQDDNYFPPDTTEIIVQKVDVQFGVPMRVGDRLGYTVELGGCSALKQTKLGPGYFVTRIERVTNQNNELVGQRVQSILHYSKP